MEEKSNFVHQETGRRLGNLEVKVDLIMSNHLPHIETVLNRLSDQTGLLLGIGKIVGTASLLALLAAIFKLIILQ